MPLIKMQTNVPCDKAKKESIVMKLSKFCADCTGKPEIYVASMLEDDSVIAFAGKIRPAAFIEVRGIGGLSPDVNKKLSAAICGFLKSELEIEGDCVYINFIEIAASNWGWKSSTFG